MIGATEKVKHSGRLLAGKMLPEPTVEHFRKPASHVIVCLPNGLERGVPMRVMLLGLIALAVSQQALAQAYEGQIDGEFKGWEGETVYKLMDGHIIQQTSYHYHYHYAYSPRVIIYKSQSGGFKIHVEGDSDDDVGITILK